MSLLDQIKAERKKLDSKKSRDFATNPPPGNSRWRVLPHWSGAIDMLPQHSYGQHFIKDPDSGEVKAVVVCASKTFDAECEVCNQLLELKSAAVAAGDVAKENYFHEARAQQKYLVNAVRFEKGKGYHDEVTTLAMPMTAYEQLISVIETYDADGVNIFDPKAGHDIVIVRTGTGRSTSYAVMAAPTTSEIPDKYLENIQNLDEYVNQINEEKTRVALASLRGRAGLTALPAATAPAALPASVATAKAETVSEGPASVADALGDVDLESLDLGDLNMDDLKDVI